MKSRVTLIFLAVFTTASGAFAGLTYNFESTTSGLGARTMTGTVSVEGANVRVAIGKGDGMLFKDGSLVVSTDGGKTLSVIDSATKSYYDLNLGDLVGDGVMKQLGGTVSFDVENPQVTVRDGGDAGAIEGYPVHKSTVDSSYDMIVNAMGQKMPMQIHMTTEVLWTDRFGSEFTNFMQIRGMRTGVEAIDKIIAAQTGTIKGFPLKQTTTTRVEMNGNTMTSTTASTVSGIQQAKPDASEFALPAGYTKTENPVEKMLKSLGR